MAAQFIDRRVTEGFDGGLLDGAHHPFGLAVGQWVIGLRSEEHTSELQSLMRIAYAVFCLKKKNSNHARQHYLRQNYQQHTMQHTLTRIPLLLILYTSSH